MPVGIGDRTIFDKAQVVCSVKHAPDRFRIEVWRSFAGHVWTLLARREPRDLARRLKSRPDRNPP